jgi:hypothetical protein
LIYISGLIYAHKLHSLEENTKSLIVGETLGGIKTQKASKIIYPPADFNKLTKKIDTVAPVCLFFPLMSSRIACDTRIW